MIMPERKDDAFLDDVAAAEVGDGFALWWLGQSGFLLKHRNRHVLFDPYLSDSLARKYAGTDRPHERMTEIIVDPARLDFIDVVTSSHNHTDHLDAETLRPLLEANANLQLVVPEANREFVAQRLGIDAGRPLGLDENARVEAAGFEFCGVPAAHPEVERDERGRCRFLGYVVRFGRFAVYHAGDTIPYDGMVEHLRPPKIDVALLPINGRTPQRQVPGNLWGSEAAELARQIRARLAIPCHFEMFRFNSEPPDAFVETCARLEQPFRVLKCGERFDSRELDST